MKKLFKNGLVFAFAIMLAISCVGVVETEAASKNPSLSSKSMTISLGKYKEGKNLKCESYDYNKLSVKNAKSGATYSFTSSNKKILTVKGSKKSCIITGVKAGSAKVTVKQKYRGRTTTLGTCKVTVKNATVGKGALANQVVLGKDQAAVDLLSGFIVNISYMNPSAKYTFTSNKDGFKMSQKQYGGSAEQSYTATEPGNYEVTVKETYKNKTKTLGNIKVTVLPITIYAGTVTVYQGYGDSCGINFSNILSDGGDESIIVETDSSEYTDYIYVWVEDEENDDGGDYKNYSTYSNYYASDIIYCAKAGEFTLNFYYKNSDGSKGDLIGSCKVTVKPVVVKDFWAPESITMDVGDEADFYEDCDYDKYGEYGVIMEDDEMPIPEFIITSSDESIVTVDDEGWVESQGKAGTATLTVSCGDVTKTVKVTVNGDDDY
jgi:hypothetical protein